MFALDSKLPTPLVTQIVEGFRRMVDEGHLRAGTKLRLGDVDLLVRQL